MRALVIYNDESSLNGNICLGEGSIQLNNQTVNYALIDTEKPAFNLEDNPESVVVQKKAFVCNYRDIGIILEGKKRINDSGSFIPIGSEFSGIIIKIGRKVKNLSIGDRVIPNGEYPMMSSNNRLGGIPTNQASVEFELLDHRKLIKIPDSMSFEVGAGFTIGAQTAYSMINKLQIKNNTKILITGITSNTSLFVLNALKNKNIDIYATVRSYRQKFDYSLLKNCKIL